MIKFYDATTAASLNTGSAALNGVISGDTVTLSGPYVGTFIDKNVGTSKLVNITGYSIGGTDGGNYIVNPAPTTTANITAASLTITGITANDKVYDATTAASLNTGSAALNGVISGDTVTLSGPYVGTFIDKNVGTNKLVNITGYSIGGIDGGNYIVNPAPTTTANITAASLTITGITANDKVYEATTAASLNTSSAALNGVISGDTVSLSGPYVGTFIDKNVGTNKLVNITGYSLGGTDGGNYIVNPAPTTTANITAASLTITGITANDKVYDATTAASLNTGSAALNGVISGDTVVKWSLCRYFHR